MAERDDVDRALAELAAMDMAELPELPDLDAELAAIAARPVPPPPPVDLSSIIFEMAEAAPAPKAGVGPSVAQPRTDGD